ncbi:hypothetical protein ASG59_16195 [Methylobacterium sp. Leaf466]|nr:hypothetical protein ASG59_16195 [Methylobacterium sp. Leaf466]
MDESLTAGLVVVAGTATCILAVGLIFGKLAWPTAAQVVAMPWWAWFGGFHGFVLLAGVANAVQAGQNGALFKGLDESLTAGLVVVAGTATCILAVGLIFGKLAWPTAAQVVAMPWWAWFGTSCASASA